MCKFFITYNFLIEKVPIWLMLKPLRRLLLDVNYFGVFFISFRLHYDLVLTRHLSITSEHLLIFLLSESP